jgi:alpha-2-macroglobulin
MSAVQRLWAVLCIVLGAIMSTGAILTTQNGEPEQRIQRATQLTDQGNWKQAQEIYAKLTLDPAVDGETAARALAGQALCQLQLNQVDQLDAALKAAVAARPNDWQVLQGAALLLTQTQHQGVVADQQFTRGYSERNGGVFVQTQEQDRLQALKWFQLAIEKAKQSGLAEDSSKYAQLYLNFADTLIQGRSEQQAWQLQSATDLTETPDYIDLDSQGYPPARFAPANDNQPVTYAVPDTFEAALNDGARFRWALAQVKSNPEALGAMRRWADFLNSQFSVDTLQQDMWFFQRSSGGTNKEQVEGIAAIHTLADDEAIAKLSTGIKRFKLADEFNPIHQYQVLAASENKSYAEPALGVLFQIFLDRRQYPKAAAMMRQSIDRFGPGNENYKLDQLNNIIQPRVAFDPVDSQVANKPSELSLLFRNANEIEFTAWSVDIEKMFADAKQAYKQLANQQKPNFGGIPDQFPPMLDSPGEIFTKPEVDRYVKGQAAKWQQTLEPRENHWDRRIQIKTPLDKAGLYLVEGRVNQGAHKARCLMWIQDSVLTRKPGDAKQLYFMSDAETGKPVVGANLEFFGYGQEPSQDGQYRMAVSSFAAKTDALGIASVKLKDGYQWITVGRTANGRLALQGMEHIWQPTFAPQSLNELKAYGISDRPMYRPGETVKTKFWIAQSVYGDAPAPRAAAMPVTISMRDQQGTVLASKEVTTDRFGSCEGSFELPKTVGLGHIRFDLTSATSGWIQTSLAIRVEEYRKPEFEVKVLGPEKPVALGETVEARIQAKYYFGSPVTDANVTVRVQRSTYSDSYYPIGRFDWCYGPGYWWFAEDYPWYPGFSKWRSCWPPLPPWRPGFGQEPAEVVLEQELNLDATGEAKIKIDTALAKAIYGDEDHKYTISVEVRDSSRRTLTAEGSVIAAREAFKIYSWVDRGFYNIKDKIVANFHARTLDGTAIAASGGLDLLRITYAADGKPTEWLVDTFEAKTNAEGMFTQVLEAGTAGQYRLRLRLKDNAGHEVESGYIFTVRGRATDGKNFRYNGLELTTDKREYAAGETVKLMLAADRDDAQVYVFVRPSSGVYQTPKLVPLQSKSAVFEIAVTEADQPNFYVEAFTVYEGEVHQKTREIIVPPANRTLDVKLTSDKPEYLPGEEAEIELHVTDPNGKPVSGSCLIAAYDSSLDQIASDVLPPDIREFFWKWRRHHYPQQRSNVDQPSYPVSINGVPPMSPLGRFGESQADDFDATFNSPLSRNVTKFKRNSNLRGLATGGMMGDSIMGGGMGRMEAMSAASADASGGAYGGVMAKGVAASVPGAPGAAQGPKPVVRKDFADSALWLGNLVTDTQGRAKAKFKMPDNLTTWKINGWAMGPKTEVGSVELKAVTRRNLLVRLQTPRFLVQRDEAVLSAVVNNDFAVDKQVRVKLEIDGQTQLELMAGVAEEQVVLVKSHGQTRVDWRTTALAEGDVKLRVSAVADDAADAVEQSLPILVHGFLKTDSFAGTIRGDHDQSKITVAVPVERRVEQSELVIRVSPTLAMAMIDALPYLAEYPYGCTEQTLNRFLPTVLTQRVLLERKIDLAKLKTSRNNLNAQELGNPDARRARWQRFERNPVYDREVVDEMVASGVQKLTNMQNGDGGWGWFSGHGENSYPHTTATVLRGLHIAVENDVAIVPDVIARGTNWLEQYQNNEILKLKNGTVKPTPTQPYKSRPDNTDALVFHVLSLIDRVNPEMQQFLYDGRQHLSVYGKSLLAWSTHQAGNVEQTAMLRQNIEQFLVEDAENETAYLRDETAWWYWYGSQIEATAMYLKLLAAQDPQGRVAPRLVKYLLNNRKHATYWNSTRDTALVIEAFSDYLKATGEGASTVAAEVWLSGKRLGRVEFTPENLFTVNNTIAINGAAIPTGEHELEIRRIGDGPMYWNAYSMNFTMEEEIKPAGLEVKIERRYYSLTPTQKDLRLPGKSASVVDTQRAGFERVQLQDLAEVPSGHLVEVELLIESKNDYEYLLIEDNKPACLEAVDTQSGYFYSAGLSIYRELRDKKVGLCIRWLPRGKYSVRYQLRSEAPGTFTALPAKIEGMYAPELVGNSADFDVRVLDTQ